MARIPQALTLEEVQQSFRDLLRKLDPITEAKNVDLKGRRIQGAGKAISPKDYITKQDLENALDQASKATTQVIRKAVALTASAPGPAPAPSVPAPTHPIDYGYYLVDRPALGDPTFGDFYSEVSGYTNLYHAWAGRGYANSQTPVTDWLQSMSTSLKRASGDGKRIHIIFGVGEGLASQIGTPSQIMDAILDIAQPVWGAVKTLDLSDESIITKADAEANATLLRGKLQARGLAVPFNGIGLDLTVSDTLNTNVVNAAGLDWIGIEAYVDPPGSADSKVNIAALNQSVRAMKSRIPAGKKISLIMMGYARNGGWTNMQTLLDLQVPTYLLAYNDPRVFEIAIFSYGRTSGTREHPELKTPHQAIGQAILTGQSGGDKPTCGGAGNPPNCPRYCSGGDYEPQVNLAQNATIANHAAYFDGGNPLKIVAGNESAYIADIVARINAQGGVTAIANPGDSKEIEVKASVGAQFSEHYALFATDLSVRYNPGAYRATCTPAQF